MATGTKPQKTGKGEDANLRTYPRFSLQLPVAVDKGEQELSALTRDVSAKGIFIYMDSNVEAGSSLEFTITLPAAITLTQDIRVRCEAKVVRVEAVAPGRIGVAATIERYHFLGET